MDSITHLFLGGAIAAAIAPAKFRRQAIIAGALINTLPDLDVLPLMLLDDPVLVMTWHRSATHSLLVLPLLGTLLWWLLKLRWKPVREAPQRWFWVVQAALLSHPLIDACTIYGTQLWWPLEAPPTMWSSLFIIDPLFTLPLAAGCVLAWRRHRAKRAAQRALVGGLMLAALYLGWSQLAKLQVEALADRALAAHGLSGAPHFTVPMPFNTLLWRVVVMKPGGFLEGEHSLIADRGPLRLRPHASDHRALQAVAHAPAVRELMWFSHGFLKAEQREGRLVLSDLRMGAEPDYSFRFAVAEQSGQGWRATPVQQLEWPWTASRRLPAVWRRIWSEEAP